MTTIKAISAALGARSEVSTIRSTKYLKVIVLKLAGFGANDRALTMIIRRIGMSSSIPTWVQATRAIGERVRRAVLGTSTQALERMNDWEVVFVSWSRQK